MLWYDYSTPSSQWFYRSQKLVSNGQNFFFGRSNSRLPPHCVHVPFSYFLPVPALCQLSSSSVGLCLTQVQASVLIALRKSQHHKESLLWVDGYSTSWDRTRKPEVLNSFLDDESAFVLNVEIHVSQAFTSLLPLPFVARWKQMSSIHILSPAGFRYKTF